MEDSSKEAAGLDNTATKVSVERQNALDVLKALITRLDPQDNRCTAQPWLHLLREKRKQYFHDSSGYCDDPYWIPSDFDWEVEPVHARTPEDAVEIFESKYDMIVVVDDLKRMCCFEYWDTVNVFLTEEGLNQHVKMNKHNLKEHDDFMIHAFRSPELLNVMRAIRTLVEGK